MEIEIAYGQVSESVTATRAGTSDTWAAALSVPTGTPFTLTVTWYDMADQRRLDLTTSTRSFGAFDSPRETSVRFDFDDFDSDAFDADADAATNLQERLDDTNPFDARSPGNGEVGVPGDLDGDGVPDERDAFPNDAGETSDLDMDGRGDNRFPVEGLTPISGRIVDGVDGTAVSQALVRVEVPLDALGLDGIVQTRTDRDGRYRLTVDVDTLPDTFAMTIVSSAHVPLVTQIVAAGQMTPAGDLPLEDIELESLGRGVVVIEPDPFLHHLGDDMFNPDGRNSRFQRMSEGLSYRRRFIVTAEQAMPGRRFDVRFMVKGADSGADVRRAAFRFNDRESFFLPATAFGGGFSDVFLTPRPRVEGFLIEGENVFEIFYPPDQGGENTDDIEIINPVLRFDGL